MNILKKQNFLTALLIGTASSLICVFLDKAINVPLGEWQLYLAARTFVGAISFGLVSCVYLLIFSTSKKKLCIMLAMSIFSSFVNAIISHSTLQRMVSTGMTAFTSISLLFNVIIYTLCMLIFFDLTKNMQIDSKNEISIIKELESSWILGFIITIVVFIFVFLVANSLFLHYF